jgi:LEA14-like dessication related protein
MKKGVFVGLGFLGVGAAVFWYIANQLNLAKKTCIKPVGYKIQKISAEGTIIRLNLIIKNKGSFELTVTKYSFDVFGNGQKLASANSVNNIKILPNSETELYLDLTFTPKILLENVGNILQGLGGSSWKDILLNLRGKVNCNKNIIPFIVPIDYSFTLDSVASSEESEC